MSEKDVLKGVFLLSTHPFLVLLARTFYKYVKMVSLYEHVRFP